MAAAHKLDEVFGRFDSALQQFEAAVARRKETEKRAETLAGEAEALRKDRSKLAHELDLVRVTIVVREFVVLADVFTHEREFADLNSDAYLFHALAPGGLVKRLAPFLPTTGQHVPGAVRVLQLDRYEQAVAYDDCFCGVADCCQRASLNCNGAHDCAPL